MTFKEGSRDGIIISIDGNGHTIDANMKGIIFILNAKDITIKNGYSEGCGAIYIRSNCTCRIENCIFEQNASSSVGIILNFGQTSVKDCQILDNP